MLDPMDKFFKIFARDKVVAIFLIAACFFVYVNSLSNNFVWDDEEQVVNNTVIRDWQSIPLIFTSSTFYGGGAGLSGGFYRPLVTLSFFWNYSYWGLNPFGYHLMQLFFHCANAFLVFYLLKMIFEAQRICHGRFAAIAVALLFAVHPANVESVAYVGSIGEVMYVFFILSALIVFIESFGRDGRIKRNRKLFYGSFVMLFLGLLAKETAVVVLPLMIVYLWLFLKPSKIVCLEFVAGSAVVAGLYAFLRFHVAKIAAVSTFYAPIHLAPLGQRLLTVPYETISYLGIIFFPKGLSISRHFVVTSALDPRFWMSVIALAFVVVAILAYVFKTKSKVFFFFVLWFGVALVPVLNIVPLDMTMAERWLYFPMVGFLAAALLLLADAAPKIFLTNKKIPAAILAAAVVALGARTIIRNGDWKNGLSLYGHDIARASTISPQGAFDLENNYGVELFRAGNIAAAGKHFGKSIALQPNWASPQNNLGAVLEHNGDLEGALAQYRKAAAMNYYLAYENTVGILIKMKRYGEAEKFAEESLAKFPDNENLRFKLAYLYAADNIGNDKGTKQKSLYLLSLILQSDPQNRPASQLLQVLQSGQKIEL
jgi:hypothetical protein